MTPLSRRLLGHPLVFGAVLLLAVNDQILKYRYPSWLTGKLSDVAGLVFFPALLLWAVEHVRPSLDRASAMRRLAGCAVMTALVFAWVKIDPHGTHAYRLGLAALQWPLRAIAALTRGMPWPPLRLVHAVTDPSDLIAVPFVLASPLLAVRQIAPKRVGPR